MSGHSKWSTIKRKKGAADAKRGIAFTRLSKDITLAARELGGSPDMNPALRLAIKKAKAANMPVSNIERAIKKGTGDLPGITYEDYIYEGYGPGGIAILIEILTDNKNRTLPEIRSLMTKNGGNLGESGCVSWIFHKKGIITIDSILVSEDDILEIFDLGVEDVLNEEDYCEIITSPEKFSIVSDFFENKNLSFDGKISLIPQNTVKIDSNLGDKAIKLINILEDHDDVQNIHSNFEIE
tara:strand:+ start:694 stop:1410 length:717 start_codon:yes stop_codon:yes gene_type:complete